LGRVDVLCWVLLGVGLRKESRSEVCILEVERVVRRVLFKGVNGGWVKCVCVYVCVYSYIYIYLVEGIVECVRDSSGKVCFK
jgi:hypothetical protein